MSQIFGPLSRYGQGPIYISNGTGPLPADAYPYNGLWFTADGRLLTSTEDPTHFANGLGFTSTGRLCMNYVSPTYFDQGLGFDASKVSRILTPVYSNQGSLFDQSRIYVDTTGTPPVPPWVPLPEGFVHDFTTATLGPFTHTRASYATGADHEGFIREVGDDVPVFIGARVVENYATSPNAWTAGAVTVLTDQGTHFELTNLLAAASTENDNHRFRDTTRAHVAGQRAVFSMELKAFPGDEGLTTSFQVKRNSGTSATGELSVSLTSQWVRYQVTCTLNAGDIGYRAYIRNSAVLPDTADRVMFRNVMLEPANDLPASTWVDYRTTQHSLTTNANTVDENGVVTEKAGHPLTTVEGLQLEGARTNLVTRVGAWPAAGTVTQAPSAIPAPDGSLTAHEATLDDGAYVYAVSGTPAAGTATATVWVRTLTGTSSVWLRFHTGEGAYTGPETPINEEWQPVSYSASSTGGGSSANIGIRNHSGATMPPILYWEHAQIESGSFPSSFIPTSGAAEMRAATECTSLFSNIPELPDAGLVNDFCGQVVLELPAPVEGQEEFAQPFVLFGDATNRYYTQVRADGSIEFVCHVGGGYTSVIPIATGGGATLLDLRFRILAGEAPVAWINGVRSEGGTVSEWPVALTRLDLDLSGGDGLYNIYKYVRIVPEALPDEVIEGW